MKLDSIKKTHILKAGEVINNTGIPKNYLSNNYWVQFPNGQEYPFKHLTRTAFQLSNNGKKTLEFQSNESTRKYISNLGFKINYYKQGIPFFAVEDILHFKKNAGKKYRKLNSENVLDSKLLNPLTKKLNIWAENSIIEDFQYKKDHSWQWSGTFKDYLWIRIFRKNSSKKVFFVLVVTTDGLIYKIECLRSKTIKGNTQPLSKEKIFAFDNYLKKPEVNYKDGFISYSDFANYNWDILIEITRLFISNYSATFDDLERIVSDQSNSKKTLGVLILEKAPKKIKSKIPKKRSYKGRSIDWSKRQKESAKLGIIGEQLVLKFEKDKLTSLGLKEKANQVCKMLDGNGYDILSFDKNGSEIHIEVKTTTGSVEEPFHISTNERSYVLDHPENYFLYRLYNYDFNSHSASFYILDAIAFNELEFKPTNYEVSINNE